MVVQWLLLLLSAAACLGISDPNGPRVNTENGPVLGTYESSYGGHKFMSFKGIPYAEPPLGDLRFKPAQKLTDKWIGEWNAQKYGSTCLQLDHFTRTRLDNGTWQFLVTGDEDCLFLNVFTRVGGPQKKDVIFMIHGGAFMFGSGQLYGPEYVMDRDDVVYVTTNYRVGPLGFLTTGDRVVPGNNGLKDQVVALEWVNRNIENFGGDPTKVTISGLSAGGASVDYMYLTPLTKGLFQRGVSFSGSALCSWALVKDGVEKSQRLAMELGCPTTDSKTMIKCLRRRPARQIVEQLRSFLVWLYNPYTVFGPVVEVDSSRPYIDKHPREIMEQGLSKDLPWIVGVTTEEGLYPVSDFIADKGLMNQLDTEWERIAASLLFLDPELSEQQQLDIVRNVRAHYFGDSKIDIANRDIVTELTSDRLFDAGIYETAKLRKSTYLYQYGFQAATSCSDGMSGTNEPLGASHGDDVMHVANFSFVPSHTTPADIEMANVIKNIFFTFVKTGQVPREYKWETLAKSKKYLKISSPTDVAVTNEPFVSLETQKKLYGEKFAVRDEL